MFGIPAHYEMEIAHYNVPHSWAIYYMTGEPNSGRMERDLYFWVKKTTADIIISKVLHEVLFLFMEHKAIAEFNTAHKERIFDDALPFLPSPYEAARYGLEKLGFRNDEEIIEVAGELMEQMRKNELTPFGKVEIPAASLMPQDLNNPFFPVGMRPLFWSNAEIYDFPQYVPTKFLGIVDLETGYTFATASDRYCLYTNKEVYDLLLEIARKVFRSSYPDEILTNHVLLNKRGVCKILAKRAEEEYQPLINDGWQAIVEAVNSYDKTETLRYTFGFLNKRYPLPLLMLDYSISINTAHVIPFAAFRKKALELMHWDVELNIIEKAFRKTMESLEKTALSDRDMLPLFCKYFNFKEIPQSKAEAENLVMILGSVDHSIRNETARFGKNALAMLHVIMSYISELKDSIRFRSETQLGKWVSDFTKAAAAPGFSISRYIGNGAYDIASWYDVYKK